MKTDAFVDSEGMLVLLIKQTTPDGLKTALRLDMHLSQGSELAKQIQEAIRAFPPSAENSPAWVAANR